MNRLTAFVWLAAMAAGLGAANAQSPEAYRFPSADPAVLQSAAPVSIVNVSVVVRHETVRSGPYARYAQQLLGVAAPLTDKDIYTIESARIFIGDDNAQHPAQSPATDDGQPFPAFTVDRMSAAKSGEALAAEAAKAIFKLRRQRLDLISGEMGENVFGAGMSAALNEIDRLEREHLSLFFGKRSARTYTRHYSVAPSPGQPNSIVARFLPSAGLLPDGDLSGTPVVLTFKPMESAPAPAPSPKAKVLSAYRVPGIVDCRLTDDTREIAAAVLPVYQFGVTILTGN